MLSWWFGFGHFSSWQNHGASACRGRPGRWKSYLDCLWVDIADNGPGIPDIEQAMLPGWSTAPPWVQEMGFGAGMGLPNIKACSDEMQLESTVGVGTHLTITIYLNDARA